MLKRDEPVPSGQVNSSIERQAAPTPILKYYESRICTYGDTAAGAAWPNDADREKRFEALAAPIFAAGDPEPAVLDLGCGTGELFRYFRDRGLDGVRYLGIDLSETALNHAREKFPTARWQCLDVLTASAAQHEELACDWLIANGLFTVRHTISEAAMWAFLTGVLETLWPVVRRGIAFNVMSPIVDWTRDDLFHVSHDTMASFLHKLAGRRIQMRADYGLYEYACFAFKPKPAAPRPDARSAVPAYRPQLPTADALEPYLRRIDRQRQYSNHGPLSEELETRLGRMLKLPNGQLVVAASGTMAIVGAILARAGRPAGPRRLALCPGFTFVGTASAIQQSGYELHLVDVDPQSWQLDPVALARHPLLDEVGLVVPVAAFGRPVALAAWQRFEADTGIPVVVDGAASFEAMISAPESYTGSIPVALSLHATKPLAVGEGGAVVSTDTNLLSRTFQALNFGFLYSRDSQVPNTNGKLSEYHAAVGLAALNAWPGQHAALRAVARRYKEAFDASDINLHLAPHVASTYALLELPPGGKRATVMTALLEQGIESRSWYGDGLHRHPVHAQVSRDTLPVSEQLAATLIGLPVAPDLPEGVEDAILAIVEQVASELTSIRSR